MIEALIHGVGCLGPGLPSFAEAAPVLCGTRAHEAEAPKLPPPAMLPANERRRASQSVRAALAASREATSHAGARADNCAFVFASAIGEGQALHRILEAVSRPGGHVSPTQFHNSVHNTASGYWTIAMAANAPTTSLGACDFSFAVGLLEAAVQVEITGRPVLLTAYDAPYPAPLDGVYDVGATFAASFVLAAPSVAAPPGALARISIELRQGGCAPPMPDGLPSLEPLAAKNPAAHALPLLQALARKADASLSFPYHDDAHLSLRLAPC